jgi:hypothetical protein
MTITCSPLDVVLVSTSCCGVLSLPAWLASCAGAECCKDRRAIGRSLAEIRRPLQLRRHGRDDVGKDHQRREAWSNPDLTAASCSSLPSSVDSTPSTRGAPRLAGTGGAQQHCASSESRIKAMGARIDRDPGFRGRRGSRRFRCLQAGRFDPAGEPIPDIDPPVAIGGRQQTHSKEVLHLAGP